MAQYQEQTGQGQVWQRCYSIMVDNPLGGPATITFNEEKVMVIGEEVVKNPLTMCRKKFNSPMTFPLRNPQTGEPTGQTMTHLEVYKILHSLYIHTAMQRDGTIPPDEPPTGDPGMTMFY
jgi:hypothetical protein